MKRTLSEYSQPFTPQKANKSGLTDKWIDVKFRGLTKEQAEVLGAARIFRQ